MTINKRDSSINNNIYSSNNNNLSFDSNPSPIKKSRNNLEDDQDDEHSEPIDKDLDDNSLNTSNISNISYNTNNDQDGDDIKTTTKTTTNNFLDFSFSFNPNKEESESEDDGLNMSVTTEDIILSQIEILKAEWDYATFNKSPPIVLQSVFQNANKDHERSLELLKKKGIVRIFQVATSLNDYCILITTDYIRCIESLKTNEQSQEQQQKKPIKSSPIKAAPIDIELLNRNQVLDLFIKRLVPIFNQVSISKSKLFQILLISNQHQQDNIITHLVQSGLLLQREENLFLFSIPGAGLFFTALMKGRKEIISNIQRLKYKEILKKDLLKKRLKYSNVQIQLLIKDLLGSNKIKIIPTTQGELIRCIQFDEL